METIENVAAEHEVVKAEKTEKTDNRLSVRFARSTSANPKAPVASYYISLPAGMSGLTLKGEVYKDIATGQFTVSIPGGQRFGGILSAALVTAKVNGRTIAVSGEYDEEGQRRMKSWDGAVKTAFLSYLNDPTKSVQRITL
jgi:hypothetical protein